MVAELVVEAVVVETTAVVTVDDVGAFVVEVVDDVVGAFVVEVVDDVAAEEVEAAVVEETEEVEEVEEAEVDPPQVASKDDVHDPSP